DRDPGGRGHGHRRDREPALVPRIVVARPGPDRPGSSAVAVPRAGPERGGRRPAARDTAVRGADGRRALCGGALLRDPGPLADEQGRAHPGVTPAVALARFTAPLETPGSCEVARR